MTRSLKIVGKGNVKVQPDMMRFHYELVQDAPSYSDSFSKLTEQYNAIVKAFKAVGFNTILIKTSSIDVFIIHETKDTPKMFRSSQRLVFEDKIDLKRMSSLLDALRSNDDFNFSLSYFIKDPRSYNQDAIISAINDAHDKAKIMASASGVKLGDIREITYGVGSDEPMLYRAMASDSMDGMSATDISISQEVSIAWDIK